MYAVGSDITNYQGRKANVDGLVVGGVVPPDNPTYRVRRFEETCLRLLTAGDWVTLLGPRQHGKSSGLVRIAQALEDNGVRAALVDLQAFPTAARGGLTGFLGWLVAQIRHRLD